VMTSNLSISGLADIYGERITSRIDEMCNNGNNVMHMQGRNLRE
jgi:DNA replication protein DnaC